jgi:iron complex transport system substrate-binding protein
VNRKTQVIGAAIAAALVIVGLAGLARQFAASHAARDCRQHAITDMTGRAVWVPARPAHVLSTCTAATDTMAALEAMTLLAGIDEYGRVVPGTEHVAVVGRGSAPSREQVAAQGFDLAFVWWYQDDIAALLADMKIPVVRIRSGRASELPATIRLIGACVNRRTAAERAATRVEVYLSRRAPPDAGPSPRVFLELYGPLKTVGRETYANDLLTLAGLDNVAAAAHGSIVFSAEQLLVADPDAILVVGGAAQRADVLARPNLRLLRAVREGRVVAVDRYWLVAGPRLLESVSHLQNVLSHRRNPGD